MRLAFQIVIEFSSTIGNYYSTSLQELICSLVVNQLNLVPTKDIALKLPRFM